jgi:intracellular sulfur oxidation DsrE/DsrF family protein
MLTSRRAFIAQVGAGAAAATLPDLEELRAGVTAARSTSWDTSWIDRLNAAQFRVVFNASDISDGAAMNYASTFFQDYREVHSTSDAQTRPVIVFRRLGTPMALNDSMWEKYAIGEDTKTSESGAPAKRNVFWASRAGASAQSAADKIQNLHARGMISLVCSIATENWGRGFAAKLKRDVAEVQNELKANLVPGAILVPSGIYALIRAQNAGCAYMPGT